MDFKVSLPTKNLPFLPYIYISLGTSILVVLVVLLVQRFLPPQVPLFYGAPASEKQLTSSLGLIIPSLASIIISVFNVSLTFLAKDIFIKKTLVLTTFLISIFAAITTVKIIFLVGSF